MSGLTPCGMSLTKDTGITVLSQGFFQNECDSAYELVFRALAALISSVCLLTGMRPRGESAAMLNVMQDDPVRWRKQFPPGELERAVTR
jgi:hypothetical protein